VLLGDPERELLLEPPGVPVLAGGAIGGGGRKSEGIINYVNYESEPREKLTSGTLDLELWSGSVNVAVVGWVNELDRVTGSVLQGHVGGDGETLFKV